MLKNFVNLEGFFRIVHTRGGLVLTDVKVHNAIVNQGKNSLLDRFFRGVTPTNSTWDFGFISTVSPTLAATDTIQSHGVWAIANLTTPTTTTFTGGTNGFQAVSSQSVSSVNSQPLGTPATITTAGAINGLFLCSTPTGGVIGSTGDILWSTVALGTSIVVAIGDVVYVTYTCTVGTSTAGITNQGKDRLLDSNFLNNLYTWKFKLYNGSVATISDTLSSHVGWTDVGQSAATPTWEPAGNTVTAAIFTDTVTTPGAQFSITANVTVNGIYIFDQTNTWLFANASGDILSGGLSLISNELVFIDYELAIT